MENLKKTAISFLGGKSLSDRNRYPRANGGLFSTAGDYAKFCQMILNRGELDGRTLSQTRIRQTNDHRAERRSAKPASPPATAGGWAGA